MLLAAQPQLLTPVLQQRCSDVDSALRFDGEPEHSPTGEDDPDRTRALAPLAKPLREVSVLTPPCASAPKNAPR